MAEVGGMLAVAVLELASGMVGNAIGDRIMLQWRFDEDLERMRDMLESIKAVLADAERQSIELESVRLWLKRLTRASYSISDMFDEFEVYTTRKLFSRKFGMASKMEKVREELENITNLRNQFSFTAGSSSYVQQVINERATSSNVIEIDILGRDEEKEKVVRLLKCDRSSSSEFLVLPIWGIGGIGKTTLAQLLFNDTRFKCYEKAWVYVSQAFDLNKIKDSITYQLQKEQSQPVDKNILIVLDDLWEKNDFKLDDLKSSLKLAGNGHKVHVIVTTRDAEIARKIQTTGAHKIEPLSDDTCWDIIKQKVSFENRTDKERLEVTGREIAKKCAGVALAARALGYMLNPMASDGWVSVKHNGIWNVSRSGDTTSPYDNVLASLKLSYSSMPPYLRLCFAYCAIFPKGHKMAKDDLIYQWAALGFVKLSDEASTWQHVESGINQLLGMSFLQRSKSSSSGGQHGKDSTLFTMHDLVHDLATSIMQDEFLDATTEGSTVRGRNYRYVSLAADRSEQLNSYPDKIRALRLMGSGKTGQCAAGISAAKHLRVLDLGEYSIQNLPSSIGRLKQLRYLNLSGSSAVSALPESIGEMEYLMYLDLSGCLIITTLPKSFGKLKNLVHLDFSGCSLVRGVSKSLENLTKLQYLNLSCCKYIGEVPEALSRLTGLQYLNLSRSSYTLEGSDRIPKTLHNLTKLRYLNLSRETYSSDELAPAPLLAEMIGELNELRCLNLSGCLSAFGPTSLLDSISTLSDLEHLDLSSNIGLEEIPSSFCSLRKLHTLDLTDCLNLSTLPRNMGDMDSLKFLLVDGCSINLLTLPRNLISLPRFVVHAAEGEESSNLAMLKDATPDDLWIISLENVKSVQEARGIQMSKKQGMVKLTLDWTRGKKGSVEDMELLRELEPPRSLEHLGLEGYKSVNFPAWLLGIANYLPNLGRVELRGLSQCTSLPPLGQLPNLRQLLLEAMPGITKIDRGFCGSGVKAFTRLEELIISDMESLAEWSMAYSPGEGVADEVMFPNLLEIEIHGCQKLRFWCVTGSSDGGVLSQWGETTAQRIGPSTSSALAHDLRVESCTVSTHQWKLLHHLPSLKRLTIELC